MWYVIGKDDLQLVPGGLNRYVFGLVGALRSSGVNVELIVSGEAPSTLVNRNAVGFGLIRAFKFFIYGWKAVGSDHVINIHFAFYGAPFLLGVSTRQLFLAGKNRSRLRVIYNYHGPWSEESRVAAEKSGIRAKIKELFEEYCLKRSDAIIVLSAVFADDVLKRFGVAQKRIFQLRPGVDDIWFESSIEPSSGSVEEIRLICVRRLTARMGHISLLSALNEIDFKVNGKTIHLTIVGNGAEESAIRSWITENSRSELVTMSGYVSDVELRLLMTQSTSAVIPTTALEGFGLVVIEAMAMGLPVLSTGQGGLAEAMGPWARDPYIFRLDDPISLGVGILEVSRMAAVSSELESLRSYASGFNWKTLARELVEISGHEHE